MMKITKIGKVRILNDQVIKEDRNNKKIFEYLKSREFNKYLEYETRINEESIYPYVKDNSVNNYQKGEDLIKIIAELHNKTSYNKEINNGVIKGIKDNILGYINYLDDYYLNLLNIIELVEIPSPSKLLFISNYSKLLELFDFIKSEINIWYEMTYNNTEERLVFNHGNIKLEHFIRGDNDYLISWDNGVFDSPIIDIVRFYHNEIFNLDFKSLLKIYFDKCEYKEDEKKLLFINLAIPKKIEFTDEEMINIKNVRELFDYIYKTEELIRPYYSK